MKFTLLPALLILLIHVKVVLLCHDTRDYTLLSTQTSYGSMELAKYAGSMSSFKAVIHCIIARRCSCAILLGSRLCYAAVS